VTKLLDTTLREQRERAAAPSPIEPAAVM